MIYVALLRGINVAGKNKVDMKLLKKTFEKEKMEGVTTYINTGNIIFTTKKKQKDLPQILEKAIAKDFKLNIKVVIRSLTEITKLMKALPKTWTNDDKQKSDILFLWEEIDNKSILDQIDIKKGIDTVKYIPGTLLWNIERKNQTKSGLIQLAKNKLYKQMTIRNVNTTRKIYELMTKL